MQKKKRPIAPNSGFTLIETFVAITILMVAVLGPLSLISQFYADNAYSRNQIAATFLAQDGAEAAINILRNIKQGFMEQSPYGCVGDYPSYEGTPSGDPATGKDWMGSLGSDLCRTSGCNVDSLTGYPTRNGCPSDALASGCPLYKTGEGFYTAQSGAGEPVPYTRIVMIEDKTPAGEAYKNMRVAEITSRVWWSGRMFSARPVEVKTRVIERLCD